MRNQIINWKVLRVAVITIWLLRSGFEGFAQGNAAQAQPIKKTNTTPVSNTGATKPAPWEKQPVLPGKSKTTGNTSSSTSAVPSQAQPIQHK
jgi:hypothetical protein